MANGCASVVEDQLALTCKITQPWSVALIRQPSKYGRTQFLITLGFETVVPHPAKAQFQEI